MNNIVIIFVRQATAPLQYVDYWTKSHGLGVDSKIQSTRVICELDL